MSAATDNSESDDFASAESDSEVSESSAGVYSLQCVTVEMFCFVLKELDEECSANMRISAVEGNDSFPDTTTPVEVSPVKGAGKVDERILKQTWEDSSQPCGKIIPRVQHSSQTADIQPLSGSLSEETITSQTASSSGPTTVIKTIAYERCTINKPSSSSHLHKEVKGEGSGWGGWGQWGNSLWSSVSTVAESAQAIGQSVSLMYWTLLLLVLITRVKVVSSKMLCLFKVCYLINQPILICCLATNYCIHACGKLNT